MYESQYFQFLVYLSLISFNILMILSIIATIVILVNFNKLSNKGHETLDQIHLTASNFGESALNFGSLASQFTFFKKKKSIISKIISAFLD